MIIFFITIIIELTSLSLITIWFAGGALIAIIIDFTGYNMVAQVIGFILTSILAFLLFRPVLMEHVKKPKIKTNADSLVGKTGEVIEEITPLTFGLVKVSGQVWTAKSKKDVFIGEGSVVDIVKIEGVKLVVEENR